MTSRNLYLILASGEIHGIGFWLIDTSYNYFPMTENKDLLECHRKELIGEESADDILYAINFNFNNLINSKEKFNTKYNEYAIIGISFWYVISFLYSNVSYRLPSFYLLFLIMFIISSNKIKALIIGLMFLYLLKKVVYSLILIIEFLIKFSGIETIKDDR